MSPFAELDRELARWAGEGLAPRLFLRDDDATRPSPALDRLIALARRHRAPVLLAIIPADATPALAERIAMEPLVTPCVHGYAHRRHTPDTEKAVELGGDRDVDEVLAELRAGRARLQELFGSRLSGILVPPWNRIAPAVAARVHEAGFRALSTHAWRPTGTRLPELNTHVDIFDWHGGRKGRPLDWTIAETRRRLGEARARGGLPVGILSHHLVHDDDAWATLDGLLSYLTEDKGLAFRNADDLAAALPPPAQ